MARCGVDSRRKCEDYIRQGRVRVNGQVVEHVGTIVDPEVDVVQVDGRRIAPQELVILAFHKPAGVLSAVTDASDRPTVVDLLPDMGVRLYPVGRLDWASEGLLLLSNDGELAYRILHPRHGVEREYEVKCRGTLTPEILERLRTGVELSDGPTHPARVSLLRKPGMQSNFWLRFVLTEGRNRIVRRMCEAVGLEVLRLRRVRIGGVLLGDLEPGRYRHLNSIEKESLLNPHREETEKKKKRKPNQRVAGKTRKSGRA